jgi:hypothetical protein
MGSIEILAGILQVLPRGGGRARAEDPAGPVVLAVPAGGDAADAGPDGAGLSSHAASVLGAAALIAPGGRPGSTVVNFGVLGKVDVGDPEVARAGRWGFWLVIAAAFFATPANLLSISANRAFTFQHTLMAVSVVVTPACVYKALQERSQQYSQFFVLSSMVCGALHLWGIMVAMGAVSQISLKIHHCDFNETKMIDLDDCPEWRATARDKTWLYELQMPLLLVAGVLLCLATWRTKDLVGSEYMQIEPGALVATAAGDVVGPPLAAQPVGTRAPCRFEAPLTHFTSESPIYSVALFLKR